MNIQEAAIRVKRGVKLLERKIPNWRTILRKHADEFEFSNGEHCVLGTLEHYSRRMKQLTTKESRMAFDDHFGRAYKRLGIDEPSQYGFDSDSMENVEYPELDALWRAEFEQEA